MKYDIKDVDRYDYIINLPHHVSKTHLPMATPDRAAQFSPFAALAGYDGAIKETARLTDERVELDEAEKNILDQKLSIVEEQLCNEPEITVTFFRPDEKKVGGAYVSISGIVNKIDYYKRAVLMQDGTRIKIEDISNITGGLFSP